MERATIWQERKKEKLESVVEIDEAYVKAGLKGRNNQGKIKALGRKAREERAEGEKEEVIMPKNACPLSLCVREKGRRK